MNEFFTWEMLGTFAGAVAATAIVVQLIKEYIKWPTQLLSYVVALFILMGVTGATGGGDWSVWTMTLLNAVVVSLAANGGFSAVKRLAEDKKE